MEKTTSDNSWNRRDFIKTLALGSVAVPILGGLASCSEPNAAATDNSADDKASWDGEYDVIVCGGGGSGLVAAYSALENGAEKVVVFEKATACGGTTAISDGNVMGAGTSWQAEAGIKDDTANSMFDAFFAQGEGVVDEALVRSLADSSAEDMEWFADSFNITFGNLYGAYSTPYMPKGALKDRIHVVMDASDQTKLGGSVWIQNTQKAVEDKGGIIETGVEVSSLIQGDSGIEGITTADGKTYKANKGVVLAMSSIDHNETLARQFNAQQAWSQKNGVVFTAPTNTGDGITMGMAAGAQGAFFGSFGLLLPTASYAGNANPEVPYVLVNAQGARFCREDTTYGYYTRCIFEESMRWGGADGSAWMILDNKMASSPQCSWSDEAEGGKDAREAALADGSLIQADSIDALASTIGVSADSLRFTMDKWNHDAEAGIDSLFGREKQVVALDEAPFFAWKAMPINIGSIGGLLINTDAAVIDVNGEVIPKLYAVGNNSAGWLGRCYPGSGASLIGALHWGRVAGKSVASS